MRRTKEDVAIVEAAVAEQFGPMPFVDFPEATTRITTLLYSFNGGYDPTPEQREWMVDNFICGMAQLERTQAELSTARRRIEELEGALQPSVAPDWYSAAEIENWLVRIGYSMELAVSIAEIIATNYQRAFNKGYDMGKRQSLKPTLQEGKAT